jgi:hypothetical protein
LSGVAECGEEEASVGACGPQSLIGHSSVLAGVGSSPVSVTGGKVYLTGPYKGAPFGLSIVNPAKAGPFDLGNVIVRARIDIDPNTAALTVATGEIPHILDGIPLQIKHVRVTVNRHSFTIDPTSCAPMSVTGTIGGGEGASAPLDSSFQVTNCAALKFAPKLTASTSGKTSKANGASLHVKLVPPHEGPQSSTSGGTTGSASGTAGTSGSSAQTEESNISRVKVDLPKQLPSRLTTLQKACTAVVFDANPAACPAASVVASAKAITPILPVPLEGPAYFVSHGNEAFPQLILVLQGYGITIDLVGDTFISKAGITSSTFAHVPDAPVSSFELTLPQGKYSALAANGNLCGQKLVMPTAFTAQNGAEINQNTHIEVTGCPNTVSIQSHSIKKHTLTLKISVPAAGKLTGSGKGVGSSSKTSSGRETVSLTLSQNKAGKLKTSIKLTFTPKSGMKLSKSLTVKFRQ